MTSALIFSFFLTPFLSRRPYDGDWTVESVIFAAFLVSLVLQPKFLNFFNVYKTATVKGLVWTPPVLLSLFMASSLFTIDPWYQYIPYFAGYILIFFAAARVGANLQRTNRWLNLLPFLTLLPAAYVFNTVNQPNEMRWTEFSLLIGFAGLLSATFCNLRTISGLMHCAVLGLVSSLTVMSLSIGGILSFFGFAAVIIIKRLHHTRVPSGRRVTIATVVLISLLVLAFTPDNNGVTIADRVETKFSHHFVKSADDEEADVRVKIYDLQWQLFKENWQLGIGLERFKSLNTAGHGGVPIVNHSNLLKCLSEGGILVGLGYLMFLYYFMRFPLKVMAPARNSSSVYSPELLALACGIAFLIIRGFAMDTLFLREFFALAGLFAGRYSVEARSLRPSRYPINIRFPNTSGVRF